MARKLQAFLRYHHNRKKIPLLFSKLELTRAIHARAAELAGSD
jgi:hypothetical protein